ncbi:MAG TPA: S-ribosylhomocysteine lyase, partial [Candidatus Erysipelatoclostridium merdavium]|nr:S-ribosylhomocysteine lyase [Candidatus Erysipelatoclostridium merdavium]
MERITSFSVDHTKLTKGVYISRVDDNLTTYDIRMTTPNIEPALKPEAAHTIEHIGATLLRNGKYRDKIIYFGPMGCMTGFYLITKDLDFDTVIELVKET